MNDCLGVGRRVNEYLGSEFHATWDEPEHACIIHTPFFDSLGDHVVLRIRQEGQDVLVDDAGLTSHTAFLLEETTGSSRHERLVERLVEGFGARVQRRDGLVQLSLPPESIARDTSRFLKLVLALDTLLADSSRELRASDEPHKQSLGPRASQKLHHSLRSLIAAQRVQYKGTVDGMVVPNWLVDVVYELRPINPSPTKETVLIIAVDLAVQDPIQRATHAHGRAWDIKKRHSPYDIRVVYDTHGQNGTVGYAVDYLREYGDATKAYAPVDISTAARFTELVHRIDIEAGHDMLV